MTDPTIEELLIGADRPRELRQDELDRLRAGLRAETSDDAPGKTIHELNGTMAKRPPKTWRNYGLYLAAAALLVVAGFVGVLASTDDDESGLTIVDAPEPTPSEVPTTEPTVAPTPEPTAEPEPTTTPEPVPTAGPIQGLPEGVASQYQGTRLLLSPNGATEPAAGGNIRNLLGTLTADDGTEISVTAQVLDLRVEGGIVECVGQVYEGPFTMDTDRVSAGVVEIVGVGKMNVFFERSILVAENSSDDGLICEENTGYWRGFSGDLDGRVGTFERLRTDLEAWWTFE